MVRATGLTRPDRGTIGASSDHRDYLTSTHGDQRPVPCDWSTLLIDSGVGVLGQHERGTVRNQFAYVDGPPLARVGERADRIACDHMSGLLTRSW